MASLRRLLPALLLAAAAEAGSRQGRAPLDLEVELDPRLPMPGGPAGAVLLQAQIQSYLGGRSLAKADRPARGQPWGPEEITNPEPFRCSDHPGVCEKLNCKSKRFTWKLAPNGHIDPHLFCVSKGHMRAAQECIAGNVSAYARTIPAPQREIPPGGFDPRDVDGQYCYNSGHCTRGLQDRIYDGMSLSEAEALCDRRYGREAWTAMTVGDIAKGAVTGTNMAGSFFYKEVEFSKEYSTTMAKVACAMGNYHCDQAYCRMWFCDKAPYKDQEYARIARESFAGNRTGDAA